MAHWLSWKCGIGLHAARQQVRVARALEGLPMIAEALGKGELSYSKARALTKVATPATEGELVELALHATASHIETFVRHVRRVDADEADVRHESRQLTWFYDDDGMLVSQLRIEPQEAPLFLAALAEATPKSPKSVPAGTCSDQKLSAETLSQRRADAFMVVIESFLANGETSALGWGAHHG